MYKKQEITHMENKQYTLSQVLELLHTTYGYTKSRKTLQNAIDKMPDIERQKTSGKTTKFYSNKEIEIIAQHLGLQKHNFRNDAIQIRNANIHEFKKESETDQQEHNETTTYRSQFNTLATQFMVTSLFENGFSNNAKLDSDSLKNDLEKMDYLINYGDLLIDIENISKMLKLEEKIKDYKNYISYK